MTANAPLAFPHVGLRGRSRRRRYGALSEDTHFFRENQAPAGAPARGFVGAFRVRLEALRHFGARHDTDDGSAPHRRQPCAPRHQSRGRRPAGPICPFSTPSAKPRPASSWPALTRPACVPRTGQATGQGARSPGHLRPRRHEPPDRHRRRQGRFRASGLPRRPGAGRLWAPTPSRKSTSTG